MAPRGVGGVWGSAAADFDRVSLGPVVDQSDAQSDRGSNPPLGISTTIPLSDGRAIPAMGLGVWQIPDGRAVEDAVHWALEAGIRHIDTARLYRNERGVGEAIRTSGVPREDIWLTTKLFPLEAPWVERALRASLKRLHLDYVDLYLVHFPPPGALRSSWKRMESVAKHGLAKSIGVSNYTVGHLNKTLQIADVKPAVNQIHLSPYHYSKDLVESCNALGVAVEAYSPLARGRKMNDPVLVSLASAHGKSPAQILIRWGLQHGFILIPKSARKDRIESNADVYDFALTSEEMLQLDASPQLTDSVSSALSFRRKSASR